MVSIPYPHLPIFHESGTSAAYSSIELGLACQWLGVELIAPLRLSARLFETCRLTRKPSRGRPGFIGPKLASLSKFCENGISTAQGWRLVEVSWYGGVIKKLWVLGGRAVWYSNATRGSAPLVINWVLVRDPNEHLTPKAYFSTELWATGSKKLVESFVHRWNWRLLSRSAERIWE